MSRVTSVRFNKFGTILAGGAALALVLAACSPAATVTPTTAPLATEFPTEALNTPLASEAATSAATEAATSAATEAATSGATAAVTANATSAGTEVVTNAPLLIESDKLLGMSVMDTSGATAGTIMDVMVDTTGTVQAVVLNLSTSGSTTSSTPEATSAASTEAATSAATEAATTAATAAATTAATEAATTAASTQTAANVNTVAIPWTSIKADPTTQQLTYQGLASDLMSMTAFDESKVSDGYVVRAQTAGVPTTYDGLIRLGGSLSDINLQTPANEKLGDMQHVIIDMQSGMATYAVVDFGGFLGVGAESVLVPWNKLQLDTSDTTTTKPVLRLNVTKDSLSSAPKFDESTLSFWPTPANNDWDSQIQIFWQTAAS